MTEPKPFDAFLSEVSISLEWLSKHRPSEISALDVSATAKVPYKVLCYRAAMIWRTEELG